MRRILIDGGDLVLPDHVRKKTSLFVEGGRISSVGEEPDGDFMTIDARGKYVLPGLIDIHTHGRLVFLDPDRVPELMAEDISSQARDGVTAYLPTLASAPAEAWLAALPAIGEVVATPPAGAVPLGVHLEGIFINPEAGGAHPGPLIAPFSDSDPDHEAIFSRHGGLISMMTFAAEVPGNEKLIPRCRGHNVVMSLGHSTASPEQVEHFFRDGIRHMTHLFNGMAPVHHRAPGPATAALARDDISADFICDGYHLHPEIARLIHRCKDPSKRILVTDRVVLPLPGSDGQGPDEPNKLPDGRLAGSRLRLNRAVLNYARFTGCPLPRAVAMASLNPATLLGLGAERGSIAPGKRADLWIAGADLEPETVIIGGEALAEA